MQEVKIGFIGCGGNARGHMSTLSNLDGVRIISVCDLQEDRAKSVGEQYQATAYTEYRIMLEREDLDAIYLSLPVFAHGQPELDVIERGLPFLVEKPVAINLEIAHQVAEAVENANLITCAGYQLRYLGSTQLAKQLLASQTISLAVGKYWCGTGRGDPNTWLRQMNKSGGQLVEQATHTIDMMRYLIGEVTEVFSIQTNRVLHQIDCPDSYSVTLKFSNGATGTLTTYWAFDNGDWSHANVIDILYQDQLINWNPSRLLVKQAEGLVEQTEPSPSIAQVFVEAVRNQDASYIMIPYSDAVKRLAVSLAANQSAQSGRLVSVEK